MEVNAQPTRDHPTTSLSSNELSALRTVMSADRTLMAWVRTSLSLQSFGFTIYKLLQGFISDGSAISPETPSRVGLALSSASVLSMVLGIVEYRHMMKLIGAGHAVRLGRLTMLMALLISLTGIVLFVSIATRIL